jgi:beta-lactamase class C
MPDRNRRLTAALHGVSHTSMPKASSLDFLSLLVGQAAMAQTTLPQSELRAAVDAAVRPAIEQYQIPGMAVAIVRKGERQFLNYGVADRDSGQPVDEHTLFELGSVSKLFTATLGAYAPPGATATTRRSTCSQARWMPRPTE